MLRLALTFACALFCFSPASAVAFDGQVRRATNDDELKPWLQNMAWHHGYTVDEMQQVTGLSSAEIAAKLKRFNISDATKPKRPAEKLFVLPYPGGRHPRIGFLDGAVEPQRETKLSVFCPWDDHSYAVMDVPEAIWSNLGLTYLAHTHIDTVWTKQGIDLPQQEWTVLSDGNFVMERKLPNGIEFGTKVIPLKDHVRMKMWLKNGTDQPLSDLRVQNCVMLKGVEGFDQQSNDNKQFINGYAVAKSPDATKWIISAWDPVHRAWGNDKCPCLHSDPKFEDCPPGQTKWLRGWFSFYQGTDIDAELARIEATGWRKHPLHHVTGNVVGKVVDADNGKGIPCRLYVQNIDSDEWHFASSTAVAGSAVEYNKQKGQSKSIERHTTLSADGFQLQLPPGHYRVRAEHGKEFIPAETLIDVYEGEDRVNIKLKVKRFANMTKRGWYSGDTHVHRTMNELPNVVLAEDLNVALPLNYWVRDSQEIPSTSGPTLDAQPHLVDDTHVIYPINTEYEIFTIDKKWHTLGAVFVLNHKTPLNLPTPPVLSIAEEARRQGAILDLDKHSWNWSLMIIPVMNVDLFELSNNHHWRTEFGFRQWTAENAPPNWPEIERDSGGFTELGWTHFGLETYYTLLNCGFRMRVTAGTASGVHPVPLGHGRVYVHCDDFTYEQWMQNLNAGRSFVTQGPLLDVRFNDQLPGTTWAKTPASNEIKVTGTIESLHPLASIELIRNGEVAQKLDAQPQKSSDGVYTYNIAEQVKVTGSGWVALRCFEDLPNGKVSFAHTNPVYVDVQNQPLRPRADRVEFFVQQIDAEIKRSTDVLTDEALAEYRKAREVYAKLLETAR
ncbi:CehA/McbA family metallohydrolase [Fuerstiella marisgermanici]|uniref:Carboxypeptidase regulatory-like domain-containing protein n=1 Tax=Fuerstiella marisgermanici TaxID=1891926 RepID=A0A1P8WI77_9PLAN|nr:CehA/McbA family metallohydrolase [Fuerstiella marisgermanici]APZ93737.1 hypothetical protein Fuma_03355 [Fuerstiella marisgermanici]